MSKKKTTNKETGPDHLLLRLNAPGMTHMHRAGLGGLATTLENLSRRRKKRNLNSDLFSGTNWHEEFSWEITPTEITLNFGKPEWAGDFFEWLYSFAFQISENMIYMPGLYPETEGSGTSTSAEIRAQYQKGLFLTILQHTKSKSTGNVRKGSYGEEHIPYSYVECTRYKHQDVWESWIDKKSGFLTEGDLEVPGTINPGGIVRHIGYSTKSTITQTPHYAIPLTFALVGMFILPIIGYYRDKDKKLKDAGVIVIPHVNDLQQFARKRARLQLEDMSKTFIRNASEAVLLFEIETQGNRIVKHSGINGCDSVIFKEMPWSGRQIYRSKVISIPLIEDSTIDFYRRILQYFRSKKHTIPPKDEKDSECETYWTHSIIRPFIADNIISGKPWFNGFALFLSGKDQVSQKSRREIVKKFEGKGLNMLVKDETIDWKLDGARSLVLAVHEALRCCYGKVNADKKHSDIKARENRMDREYEHWRIAFSGAKTSEQFRYALSDMFSRAKGVTELKNEWETITRLLLTDWQSARDLALIGLASYKGKEAESSGEEDASSTEE